MLWRCLARRENAPTNNPNPTAFSATQTSMTPKADGGAGNAAFLKWCTARRDTFKFGPAPEPPHHDEERQLPEWVCAR